MPKTLEGVFLELFHTHKDLERIETYWGFVKGGIDINVTDEFGVTALHYAASYDCEVIKWLLNNGADPLIQTKRGNTPLHVAADTSCSLAASNCVLELMEQGGFNDLFNIEGFTPLMCATRAMNDRSVGHIVGKCDVNLQDENGDTALHMAARNGYFGICDILVEHGANPLLKNIAGDTPYDIARELKYIETMKSLEKSGFMIVDEIDSYTLEGVQAYCKKHNLVLGSNLT